MNSRSNPALHLPAEQTRLVFILRVWRNSPASLQWYGQIQQVGSEEVISTQGIERLFEYLRARLSIPPPTTESSQDGLQ